MEISKALLGRRTVHNFKTGSSIPHQDLEEALLAALHAPNHKHTHPWRFYLMGERAKESLIQLQLELKDDGHLSDVKKEALRAKFTNPGAIFVVTRIAQNDEFTAREDYASVAIAIQNMCLSLYEKGFGTKWSTGKVTRDKKFYEALGLAPQEEVIEGLLLAGVPQRWPEAPQKPGVSEIFKVLD